MSKRKWPVGSFVPCSPRHLHCSPAHAEFVRNYRIERHRQEVEYEAQLDPRNKGEYQHWRENGGTIVTFKSWLIAHKGSGMKHQEEAWERTKSQEQTCSYSEREGDGISIASLSQQAIGPPTDHSNHEARHCNSLDQLRAWVRETIGVS